MSPVRILVADDHALVRAGLCKLLETIAGVSVAGQATNGLEVLALAHSLQPDIVLLDIAMPGLNGLDALQQLTQELPALRCIMLTMHNDVPYVQKALKLGAAGYLLKDAAPTELEAAIAAIRRGESYLSPAVANGVVDDYRERLRNDDKKTQALTDRQREVLCLIAQGQSTKAIAQNLNLSVKTVDTHRTQLMRLLDVHEVTGLVRYAIREGLISV